MARTKRLTKQDPRAKELKKKLATKRNSLSKATTSRFSAGSRSSSVSSKDEAARFSLPANLNRSGDVSASTSRGSRVALLSKDIAYTARKSMTGSSSSRYENDDVFTARKSMINSSSDDSNDSTPMARKSIVDTYPAIRKSMGSKRVREALPTKIIRKSTDTDEPVPSTSQAFISTAKSPRKGKKLKRVFVAPHIDKRRKPGVKALQEIRYYQKRSDLLLPALPFQRVVKEILHFDLHRNEFRIQSNAISALKEATEMFLVGMFEKCQLSAIHANRVTIFNRDISLLKALDSL